MGLAAETRAHLTEKMIPFWESLKDTTYGGFYGYLGYDLELDKKYEKGCILNSRILWFFSNAFLALGDEKLLQDARHAYEFLRDHCYDREQGGIFWSVTYDGKPCDDSKHTYNQAFAVYALSSYYTASGDEEALALAKTLRDTIEAKCRDELGYLEAFDRSFAPVSNEKLSENGVMAEKTMNTLLHVMEAYTELLRAERDPVTEKALRYTLELFRDRVYDPEKGRQEVFFDREWNSLIDLYSYGHDIESSWLTDRALEVLGDAGLKEELLPATAVLAENIYIHAFRDHSELSECERGVDTTNRVWWVQAEGIVGFVNAWQKKPEETKYLRAAEEIWEYVKAYFIDPREGSEWFSEVKEDHSPAEEAIVQPWKCPYHNGRMCMEVMRRLGA